MEKQVVQVTVYAALRSRQQPSTADRSRLAEMLADRRRAFSAAQAQSDGVHDVFRYPIMAALAPVATNRGGEVAYPGDPMCLYAALTDTIRRSVRRRTTGLAPAPALDDVYPDWGRYPDLEYRRTSTGPRAGLIADSPYTDGKVFDPRVWDGAAQDQYVAELRALRPKVVLISAVSAAHRYALEMAALVKAHVPGGVVVLGGRHADETVIRERHSGLLRFDWSSTVEVIEDGRAPRVVDFLVAGDGAPCLDLLLQGLSLVSEPGFTDTDNGDVLDAVRLIASQRRELTGVGTIIAFGDAGVIAQPVEGQAVARAQAPSPYQPFAIRANFSVFEKGAPARGGRTAHLMTLDACPFTCTFCSESSSVKGRGSRYAVTETQEAAARMLQLSQWGAEAVFFDDPVFWGGNWTAIASFCRDLLALVGSPPDRARANTIRGEPTLEWGAQLTVDVVLNRARWSDVGTGLDLMREAGCSYVYVGIESMAEAVMKNVNKNLLGRNPEPWVDKVRDALEKIRHHGLRVGSSVLFGLDGEDHITIEETIEQVGRLIDDGLLIMASPNVLTYHPGTPVSRLHKQCKLDYHSRKENRPPYTYFEEAYPEVVSKLLTEDDIWYIHQAADRRWGGVRNSAADGLSPVSQYRP